MNFIQDFDWSARSIGRAIGIFLVGVIVLAVVAALISFSFRTILRPFNGGSYNKSYPETELASDMTIHSRSKIIPPIEPGEFVNKDAESFEVRDYSATYRTHDKSKICESIARLKADEEIIFESANESDRSCSYSFKVLRERESKILAILKDLDPKDLSNNVYTIQRTIQRGESQVDILKKQLAEKEAALAEAQGSYDKLQKLATRKQDIENLTKLIDLKITTIDRLAQERIQMSQELDQMANKQARQLERLKYTSFNVSVREERFVDWQQIGETWKQEIRDFVNNLNEVAQGLTVGLITWVLRAMMAIVYLAVAIILLKFVWLFAKKVWNWRHD